MLAIILYYLNFCGSLIGRPRDEVLGGCCGGGGAGAAPLSALTTRRRIGFLEIGVREAARLPVLCVS